MKVEVRKDIVEALCEHTEVGTLSHNIIVKYKEVAEITTKLGIVLSISNQGSIIYSEQKIAGGEKSFQAMQRIRS